MPNPTDHDDFLHTSELGEDTRRAATLTVCRNALDAADATTLLQMLGLADAPARPAGPTTTPDRCVGCGHPLHRAGAPTTHRLGRRRHAGYGRCGRCYAAYRLTDDYQPRRANPRR